MVKEIMFPSVAYGNIERNRGEILRGKLVKHDNLVPALLQVLQSEINLLFVKYTLLELQRIRAVEQ